MVWSGQGRSPPRPLLAVPNVAGHPSTASVPITIIAYNGPLLCGFNVPIKGLSLRLVVGGQHTHQALCRNSVADCNNSFLSLHVIK